jgi:putative component of toxin-antitoxin plasmid stabilization module
MIEIRKTEHFAKWIDGLQDIRGRARIQARIERLAMGNPGVLRQWVKEFRRCVLIMVPAIGFITYAMSDQ